MPTTPSQIADAFQQIGCSWILKDESRERILQAAAREVDEFVAAYRTRFHVVPEPFMLLEENPDKATAFFQALIGPPYSVDARLLIWHLISGFEIRSVRFSYDKGENPLIRFVTESTYGEEDTFDCGNPWDFRLFRHVGLLGYGDRVILDGFYASRFS